MKNRNGVFRGEEDLSVARIYGARTASRAYRDRARQRRRAFAKGCLKWFLYLLIAVFLCIAEGCAFAFRGASASSVGIGMPYFLPAWITAVALAEGFVGGTWFGLSVGLLSSAAGGDSLYLLPLLYAAAGLVIGLIGTHFLKKRFFLYAVLETAACASHALVRLAILLVSAWIGGDAPTAVLPLLWSGAVSDALTSAVLSLFLYLPLSFIRRLRTEETQNVRDAAM